MNLTPQQAVRGLRVLFPSSIFGKDVVVEVLNNVVTNIVTPSPVTEAEISAASETFQVSPAEKIALGQKHVAAAGYGADEKVICLNKLLKVKDACASAVPPVDVSTAYPKLATTYAWLETVQAMAVAGSVEFPPAPHTFEEVVSE